MDEGIAEAGLAALENSDEAVLAVLNASVRDIEREFVRCYQAPQHPTVFVVGIPRSGTTLLTQLLIQHFTLGYIDNIAAKFWEAPYVGVRFSHSLKRRSAAMLDFRSTYGETHTPFGPHEFGRFWMRWFNYRDSHVVESDQLRLIDHDFLRRELAAIESVFNRSVVYKNVCACSMQIGYLADLLPNAVFVYCIRNWFEVAQSLLIARKINCGHEATWYSVRPREYQRLKNLAWEDQIACQIQYATSHIESSLNELPRSRWTIVDYQKLCLSPNDVIKEISKFLIQAHANFYLSQVPAAVFTPLERAIVTETELERLNRALGSFAAHAYQEQLL